MTWISSCAPTDSLAQVRPHLPKLASNGGPRSGATAIALAGSYDRRPAFAGQLRQSLVLKRICSTGGSCLVTARQNAHLQKRVEACTEARTDNGDPFSNRGLCFLTTANTNPAVNGLGSDGASRSIAF